MKKIIILIFAILTSLICTAQQSGRSISQKELDKSNSATVFEEQVWEDQLVDCEIDSVWAQRRIVITTQIIKIPGKQLFVKLSRVYFVKGNFKMKLKTFSEESTDKYIDDILDEARLYVINDLRKLKP